MLNAKLKPLLSLGPLIVASCASGEGSMTPPNVMLFTLSRDGVPPAAEVFLTDDGGWGLTSQDACRGAKGSIPAEKTTELSKYLSAPELTTASSACTDTSFKLRVYQHGATEHNTCWSDDARKSSPAIDALSQFFDDRVKDLNWDGKKVDPCTAAPLTINPQDIAQRGAPGSPDDAPAPMR